MLTVQAQRTLEDVDSQSRCSFRGSPLEVRPGAGREPSQAEMQILWAPRRAFQPPMTEEHAPLTDVCPLANIPGRRPSR